MELARLFADPWTYMFQGAWSGIALKRAVCWSGSFCCSWSSCLLFMAYMWCAFAINSLSTSTLGTLEGPGEHRRLELHFDTAAKAFKGDD